MQSRFCAVCTLINARRLHRFLQAVLQVKEEPGRARKGQQERVDAPLSTSFGAVQVL